jgi:hypothetical protein
MDTIRRDMDTLSPRTCNVCHMAHVELCQDVCVHCWRRRAAVKVARLEAQSAQAVALRTTDAWVTAQENMRAAQDALDDHKTQTSLEAIRTTAHTTQENVRAAQDALEDHKTQTSLEAIRTTAHTALDALLTDLEQFVPCVMNDASTQTETPPGIHNYLQQRTHIYYL